HAEGAAAPPPEGRGEPETPGRGARQALIAPSPALATVPRLRGGRGRYVPAGPGKDTTHAVVSSRSRQRGPLPSLVCRPLIHQPLADPSNGTKQGAGDSSPPGQALTGPRTARASGLRA